MPSKQAVKKLTQLCIDNLIDYIDSYWLKKLDLMRIVDKCRHLMYLIGPFEILNHDIVDYMLKTLNKNGTLSKYHFYLCLSTYLKKLDFSYLKRNLLADEALCKFIGLNCFHLIELDLSNQDKITPQSLCNILKSQTRLKRLNLTQTQANESVLKIMAQNCEALEELCLSECKLIHDDCLLYLIRYLWSKLISLNILNATSITEDCIKEILLNCTRLKFLYTEKLVKIIHSLNSKCDIVNPDGDNYEYIDSDDEAGLKEAEEKKKKIEEQKDIVYKFNLETIYIDQRQYLHPNQFQSLIFSCPKLKSLLINSIGSNDILNELHNFQHLRSIVISNLQVLTYKFENYFVNYLKLHGKNLRKLHLVHIVDVNLRVLIETCTNLSELKVEFIQYYIPAKSTIDINNNESNNDDNSKLLPLLNLTKFSLGSSNCEANKHYPNLELFKNHLNLIFEKAVNLNNLQLKSLHVINDDYLLELIVCNKFSALNKLEVIEFNKLNNVSYSLIENFILFPKHVTCKTFASLKEFIIRDCKKITKYAVQQANKKAKLKNFDFTIDFK